MEDPLAYLVAAQLQTLGQMLNQLRPYGNEVDLWTGDNFLGPIRHYDHPGADVPFEGTDWYAALFKLLLARSGLWASQANMLPVQDWARHLGPQVAQLHALVLTVFVPWLAYAEAEARYKLVLKSLLATNPVSWGYPHMVRRLPWRRIPLSPEEIAALQALDAARLLMRPHYERLKLALQPPAMAIPYYEPVAYARYNRFMTYVFP
jgi:hypothetical protein